MSDILATALAVSAIRDELDGVKLTVHEAHLRGLECSDPDCIHCHAASEGAEQRARFNRQMADAIEAFMANEGKAPPQGWKPPRGTFSAK